MFLCPYAVKNNALIVQLPYLIENKELQLKQFTNLYEKICSIAAQNEIYGFKMRWVNSLEDSQIAKIVDSLPKTITEFRIYGCLKMTPQIFQAIVQKFQSLEHLNFFYQPQTTQMHISWDYQYQVLIQNSAKNFRISQKWLSLVNRNTSRLYSQIIPRLSCTIRNLSLRNICLGKDEQSLKIIISGNKNLEHIDIGHTQVTDKHFEAIERVMLQKLGRRLKTLRLDCNRITKTTLQLIYPFSVAEKKEKKEQVSVNNEPKLEYLDISKTNVFGFYSNICLLFSSLKFLVMSYIQISQKEVEEFYSSGAQSKIQEIIVEFITLKKQSIITLIHSHPNLVNLTLTNINPLIEQVRNQSFIFKQIAQKTPLMFQEGRLHKINLSYNSYVFGKDCLSSLILRNPELEIIKISGTKMHLKDLQVLKEGKKLKWLQISHLEQLQLEMLNFQNKIGQQRRQSKLFSVLNFMTDLVESLPKLEYLQAYGALDKKDVQQFQKIYQVSNSRQQNTFAAVLDSNGPLFYRKSKK